VLAFLCTADKEARLELETSKGKKLVLSPTKYEVSARGGRGREMARKETVKLLPMPLQRTPLPEEKKEER
jgi:DNA gyrase subunit A